MDIKLKISLNDLKSFWTLNDKKNQYYFYKPSHLDRMLYLNLNEDHAYNRLPTNEQIWKINSPRNLKTISDSQFDNVLSELDSRKKLSTKPIILFLELNPNSDPTNVLTPLVDLKNYCKTNCPKYEIVTKIFNNFDELSNCFNEIRPDTIAHLNILTHGKQESIQIGEREFLTIGTLNFVSFFTILTECLMKNASVFLTACKTGHHNDLDKFQGGDFNLKQIKVENCNYNNFANQLSINLPNNPILATKEVQVPDELVLVASTKKDTINTCTIFDKTNPFYYNYVSRKQAVFKYIQNSKNPEMKCDIIDATEDVYKK